MPVNFEEQHYLLTVGMEVLAGSGEILRVLIVLTQDIIFDYLTTGKKSPVLKLNY
jgi:hypothetical protein